MSSLSKTLAAIDASLNTPHSGKIIDKNLNIIDKKSGGWILLCLLAPFYRFFGEDPYSHVRIDLVADQILKLCEQNVANLDNHLIQKIKERILETMNKKTKEKYSAHLNDVATKLDNLVKLSIPDDYLKKLYRMNEPEHKQICGILEKVIPQLRTDPEKYSLQFVKTGEKPSVTRQLSLWEKGYPSGWSPESQKVGEWDIPLSLYIEMQAHLIHDIVLLDKKKIGSGGQTKVRACLGLLTDRPMARKKIPANQRQALQPLLERNLFTPSARGLVSVEIWREIPLKKKESSSHLIGNNVGLQLFESMAYGTLNDFFSKFIPHSSAKRWLMGDLLHGLHLIHMQSHPGFIIPVLSTRGVLEYRFIVVPPFKVAHGDLKPSNILVDQVDGNPRAQITDFGSLNPTSMSHSFGFSSPEKMKWFVSENDRIEFHQQYAQAADMWSMGLICALILSGKSFNENAPSFPPLPSIYKELLVGYHRFGDDSFNKGEAWENQTLSQVKQEEIDLELDALTKNSDPELEPLWNLAKQMLRICPEDRITVEDALNQYNSLV